MAMIIQGGTGNGYSAKVNQDNMLLVRSVQESIEHHMNHDHKRMYMISFNQSLTAANDCMFFLQNTDEDRDLIVEGFCMGFENGTADLNVYFKTGDTGTPNSGSAVTPRAMNTESQYAADVTCEKGADLDNAGAALSGGTEFFRILPAPNATDFGQTNFNFPADLILAPNGSLSIWSDDSAATFFFNIAIWFQDRA